VSSLDPQSTALHTGSHAIFVALKSFYQLSFTFDNISLVNPTAVISS